MNCFRRQHRESSVNSTIKRERNLVQEVHSYDVRKWRRKCIDVVGDWGVGKDSLALKILDMDIPDPKEERDHPNSRQGNTRNIREKTPNLHEDFDLTLRIIPGKYCYREREDRFFDQFRPGDYEVDAMVFCFALNNSTSFYNLEIKWIPMARLFCGNKMPPFILVGTKSDIPGFAVTEDQAKDLSASIRTIGYYETSARKNHQIKALRNRLLTYFTYH